MFEAAHSTASTSFGSRPAASSAWRGPSGINSQAIRNRASPLTGIGSRRRGSTNGCFGAEPFNGAEWGDDLAGTSFLPFLTIGLVITTPVVFVSYFMLKEGFFQGRATIHSIMSTKVQYHRDVAALPGFLTGCFWAMGNYGSIFATMYLGQTIGYPLTQTCIVVNGFWGILYYKEIKGTYPVGVFCAAVVVIIAGAVLDGNFA